MEELKAAKLSHAGQGSSGNAAAHLEDAGARRSPGSTPFELVGTPSPADSIM